ncbi:MAG: hypothetical protein ACJAXH_001434 [Colwellia sp.]|jgi:hypothetical protein
MSIPQIYYLMKPRHCIGSMYNTLNIFVIETELQYLAYTAIRKIQSGNNLSIIFTTSLRVYNRLCSDGVSCDLVSRKSSGWVGRLIRLRKNLALYKKRILELKNDFSEINFHAPRIDNIHNNIVINFLKYNFSLAQVNIRLIPDGAINIFSCEMSTIKLKKQRKWLSNIGFKLFPDMNYHVYNGDELGADSEVVDKIYCFKGIETNYPRNKIILIDFPLSSSSRRSSERSVLVIGQNFLQLATASQSYIDEVSNEVYRLVSSFSPGRIDYAPHPRSTYNEFGRDEYTVIDDDYLCIEEKIAGGGYEYIVSCYSSALINSKIMFGDDINTYSIGLDCFPFPDDSQRDKLITAYQSLGIKVLGLK